MTEGLFVLITMFVAYVVYVIVGEEDAEADKNAAKDKGAKPVAKKAETKAVASKPEPTKATSAKAKPAKKAATTAKAKPEEKAKKATEDKPKAAAKKPAAKKATEKKAPAKKEAEKKPAAAKAAKPAAKKAKPASNKVQLRNPETGEVSTVPNGYRFYKRWIKDVMVKEGLVEKVYKNNELDDAANAKIKTALDKLKAMDKYKA